MLKSSTALVLGLLAACHLAAPAQAQSSDNRVNQLLNKLEQATQQPAPPAAMVDAQFIVTQKVTLSLPDGPNCPCFARGTVSQFSSAFPTNTKTIALVRSGKTCTGTIRHRVHWTNADNAANVNASVSAFTVCPDTLDPVDVAVSESSAPFPLPANGTTKAFIHVLQD